MWEVVRFKHIDYIPTHLILDAPCIITTLKPILLSSFFSNQLLSAIFIKDYSNSNSKTTSSMYFSVYTAARPRINYLSTTELLVVLLLLIVCTGF